jgi:hypothetical protein
MLAKVLSNATVKACINGRPYKDQKQMPVDKALSDNNTGWQNFVRKILKLLASVCNTHLTGIGAVNGSHKKFFKSLEVYEQWYKFVCRIKDIAFEEAGRALQEKLIEWLRGRGENEAADWVRDWWHGAKGQWLLANGSIGLIGNNQGIESKHRWDRESICCGRQVIMNMGNFEGVVGKL